jgi:hypothetical protein
VPVRSLFPSVFVLAVALGTSGAADDKPKPPDTPSAKLDALEKEAEKIQKAAYEKYEKLSEADKKDEKKVKDLFEAADKEALKLYTTALDLAKADPSSDVGFKACQWILSRYTPDDNEQSKAAAGLVTQHHAANPKVGELVAMLGQSALYSEAGLGKVAMTLLDAVAEKNKDKTTLGQVAMARAWMAKKAYSDAESKGAKNLDELAAVAERALEGVAKGYGECKLLLPFREEKKTLAETVKPELYELRNLRVGKPAPEIEGEDVDGKKFKLSDYKGKVVMLDFWADW